MIWQEVLFAHKKLAANFGSLPAVFT